jgi:hypothetical protein
MKRNMAVACTMAKPAGRVARIVIGAAIISVGLMMTSTTVRDVLVIVGLVPILAGVVNICAVSALIGAPLSGRRALKMSQGVR